MPAISTMYKCILWRSRDNWNFQHFHLVRVWRTHILNHWTIYCHRHNMELRILSCCLFVSVWPLVSSIVVRLYHDNNHNFVPLVYAASRWIFQINLSCALLIHSLLPRYWIYVHVHPGLMIWCTWKFENKNRNAIPTSTAHYGTATRSTFTFSWQRSPGSIINRNTIRYVKISCRH